MVSDFHFHVGFLRQDIKRLKEEYAIKTKKDIASSKTTGENHMKV